MLKIGNLGQESCNPGEDNWNPLAKKKVLWGDGAKKFLTVMGLK